MCFTGENNDMTMLNDTNKKCPTLRISIRQSESVERIGLICRKGLQNIKNGDSTFEFTFIHPDNGKIKKTNFLSTNSTFAQEIKLVTDIYYDDIEFSCPKYPINFELESDYLPNLKSLRYDIIDLFNSKHSEIVKPIDKILTPIGESCESFNNFDENFNESNEPVIENFGESCESFNDFNESFNESNEPVIENFGENFNESTENFNESDEISYDFDNYFNTLHPNSILKYIKHAITYIFILNLYVNCYYQ